MPILNKSTLPDGKVLHVDPATGQSFRRLEGGLAWPGDGPGFGLVVGEASVLDRTVGRFPFHVLYEFEELDLIGLISRAIETTREYQVDIWHGDRGDRVALSLLMEQQQDYYREGLVGVNLVQAPGGEEPLSFRFCASVMREFFQPALKLLYLGEDSRLPVVLQEAPRDLSLVGSGAEFPAIAALAYVVAALKVTDTTAMKAPSRMMRAKFDHFRR
ncbi:hypothetical protein LCGC14_1268080 [marine sediment metagenome]|uniref:Terminase large subunit gp17-like C-terminal domain-containing protein n=1 Tax=marine sediment metagenome TaxID=412755 RepID=A0A0F9NFK9_9ZZZZ